MEKYYFAALRMVPGIGNVRLVKLVNHFGSARQAWMAERGDLFLCPHLDSQAKEQLLAARSKVDVHKLAAEWEKSGIKICTFQDNEDLVEYPLLLKNIFNPPAVLFYRGELPDTDRLIAVVGSRRCSSYGRTVAEKLGSELAQAGFWVVSGGARGIDTAAHSGAMSAGKTLAVLGCGVDLVYPPENKKLFAQILECGCGIISEYPPGTAAYPAHFPSRNRIISGIARGVVVVEAPQRSGALITAEWALEQGRDVFAVPGSIFSSASRGCHQLIKQGAKLVESGEDVLEEYGFAFQKAASPIKTNAEPMSDLEKAVLETLSFEIRRNIEDIIAETGLPPAQVAFGLLKLQLRGIVVEDESQCYLRCSREG